MCRPFDQEKRQIDVQRFQWWNVVTKDLLKDARRKELNAAQIKMKSLCYLRAIQGHSGGIAIEQRLMGYVLIPQFWKRYIFHRGRSWNFQSILGNGLFPEGKEKDKACQAVFLTPTNHFGNDPEEEEPQDDYTVPRKAPYVATWKHTQMCSILCTIVTRAGSRTGILEKQC